MAKEGGTIVSGEHGITTICVPRRDSYLHSVGMWVGDNPFDFVVPVTLFQIIIFIIASRILYIVLRPLSTPKFVCYVLGGILVGPSILGNHLFEVVYPPIQSPILFLLGRLGAAYSVFFITLKMDIVPTIKAAKKYWKLGFMPFLSSFLVMYTLAHYTNLEYRGKLKQPSIPCWTSFPVVSDFLMELNLITMEIGQIALSTAIVSEMCQWIVLITYVLATNTLNFSFANLSFLVAFLMFLCFVVRPIMKVIIKRTPKGEPVKQGYVTMVLLGVIGMATISDIIGITFIMGPTLYGLFIPNGPPLATTIVERSEVVISELIMPFFYLTLGTTTKISSITDEYWYQNLMVEFVVLCGVMTKVLVTMVLGMAHNLRLKHGFILGLMMSIEGILDLILFHGMMRAQNQVHMMQE
ncbi:cation/H(+) antiporter 15-like [Arachis duranensis]|uniref:Cation/H(+) antiporter 15-like n=1 Tax=Arachis duranensis TaxID=130453 RepID=A0A9C6TM51_ARADU|nr:cation/H(+) antiporter 15-like [Arachis duranensis]